MIINLETRKFNLIFYLKEKGEWNSLMRLNLVINDYC